MTIRKALPGLVIGSVGLAAGLLGLILAIPLLGAAAGALALGAGVAGFRISQRLDEQAAIQNLVEAELRAVRAELAESTARADGSGDGNLGGADNEAGDGDGSSERPLPARGRESLIDRSTGLFSESFFHVALDSRIAAARRHLRPVAMVLVEVVEGLPEEPRPVDARLVAQTIKETLREADTACRLRNGYFALLLEDTPENGAIWTVERIRRQLVESHVGLTIWAGIACYPAHAFSPEEILAAADEALTLAREWRQDRIEVAAAGD